MHGVSVYFVNYQLLMLVEFMLRPFWIFTFPKSSPSYPNENYCLLCQFNDMSRQVLKLFSVFCILYQSNRVKRNDLTTLSDAH